MYTLCTTVVSPSPFQRLTTTSRRNLLRTRLQAQGTPAHPQTYSGVKDAAWKCYRGEGWKGFYKGESILFLLHPQLTISRRPHSDTRQGRPRSRHQLRSVRRIEEGPVRSRRSRDAARSRFRGVVNSRKSYYDICYFCLSLSIHHACFFLESLCEETTSSVCFVSLSVYSCESDVHPECKQIRRQPVATDGLKESSAWVQRCEGRDSPLEPWKPTK